MDWYVLGLGVYQKRRAKNNGGQMADISDEQVRAVVPQDVWAAMLRVQEDNNNFRQLILLELRAESTRSRMLWEAHQTNTLLVKCLAALTAAFVFIALFCATALMAKEYLTW
jgi:hypothetical protein